MIKWVQDPNLKVGDEDGNLRGEPFYFFCALCGAEIELYRPVLDTVQKRFCCKAHKKKYHNLRGRASTATFEVFNYITSRLGVPKTPLVARMHRDFLLRDNEITEQGWEFYNFLLDKFIVS